MKQKKEWERVFEKFRRRRKTNSNGHITKGGKEHQYLPFRLWKNLKLQNQTVIFPQKQQQEQDRDDTNDDNVIVIDIPSNTEYVRTICEESGEEKLEMVLLKKDTEELIRKQKELNQRNNNGKV